MRINKQANEFSSIPFHVLVFMSWRNLSTKKLRSFLTILGVIIGIGAIFFLLSLGLGLQNLVTKEVVGNTSIRSVDVSSPNSKIIKLDSDNVEKIANLPQVDKAGASYSFASSIAYDKSEVDAVAYGINKDYQDLSNFQVAKGRLLSADEGDGVFVNTSLLSAIGVSDQGKIIDKQIDIKIPLQETRDGKGGELNQKFKVVGVINSGSGSEIFIPARLLDQAGAVQYTQVKLLAKDGSNVDNIRKQIESMGFETSSPADTIDEINQMFKYFNIILVGFGAIGMIVAVLGMFNTLTISLLERTREIGLMLALGARRKDMRILFILESVLLSLIGSILGILMASIAGTTVNIAMNSVAKGRGVTEKFNLFSAPLWLIGSLVLFMVFVGIIVVLLPARRAEKINPIDALRRE